MRCRRLVEVVRGRHTSNATVAAAVQHLKRIGKMPIVVGDGPGFLVNRLLFPHLNEALELLLEGVAIEDIDQAATQFGMPLGPLAMYDLIGIDVSFSAGRVMWEAFPDRIGVSPVLPRFLKRGRLGRKAGRGFYRYADPDAPPSPDPDVAGLIEPYIRQRRPARRRRSHGPAVPANGAGSDPRPGSRSGPRRARRGYGHDLRARLPRGPGRAALLGRPPRCDDRVGNAATLGPLLCPVRTDGPLAALARDRTPFYGLPPANADNPGERQTVEQ